MDLWHIGIPFRCAPVSGYLFEIDGPGLNNPNPES